MIRKSPFQKATDLQAMRDLLARLHDQGVVDFDESMQLLSVRDATCLWRENDRLVAFAYVDGYNNLWFAIDPAGASPQLEADIVAWGVDCLRRLCPSGCFDLTLDACCQREDAPRMALLEKSGFIRHAERSIRYARSLEMPVPNHHLPAGFSLRCVLGETEVDSLVALHRAAFGTDHMTVAERLAIMHTPQYDRSLDLVALTPTGDLAGFCICCLDPADLRIGYTDPIGVHAHYQRLGLGKALLSAGLQALKSSGAQTVELGTSSENLPMQRLADTLGFTVISEKIWFSRRIE